MRRWRCVFLFAVLAKGGQGLCALGEQPTGPSCTRWSVAFSLTAAWFHVAGALLLPLPGRSNLACVGRPTRCGRRSPLYFTPVLTCACLRHFPPPLPIMYRDAKLACCIASCCATSEQTEPPSLGASSPLALPGPGDLQRTCPPCMSPYLPPDPDRGLVWHHVCVYTPSDTSH